MSFNVKHYVAMILGTAVCAAFVFHQPANDPATADSKIEVSALNPLASLNSIPTSSTVGLAKPANAEPLQSKIESVIAVDELMAEADLIVFDEVSVPEMAGAQPGIKPDPLDDTNGFSEIDFDDLNVDSFAMDEVQAPVAGMAQPTADSMALHEPKPATESRTHHYQRPNSSWKQNLFLAQASQVVDSEPVEELLNPSPLTYAPKTDIATRVETRDSIIVEPIGDLDSRELTQRPAPVERSVLAVNPIQPTETIDDDITPAMPNRIGGLGSQPGSAGVAPSNLAISAAVAQQAAHHIEYGKSLARRGAMFAAGQEFMSALKVIAQANDATTGSNEFSTALSQAVLAMKEAKDFTNPNVDAQMIVEVSGIVESHRTNIISRTQAKTMTPANAMTKYFAFAKQKLDQSSGRNVVSAEALYCLGKLHTAASVNKSVPDKIDVAKAITFHQAALLGNANDFRSANELGVLMAQTGQLAEATSLFKQSLVANPTPQTWQNLAKTHHRLGEQNLAQLAEAEFSVAVQTQIANSESGIHWMPTTRFNASAPMEYSDNTRVASRPPAPSQNTRSGTNDADSNNKSLSERLKDLF